MLDKLPDELLIEIIQRSQLARYELASVCMSCRRLRRVSLFELYSSVEITSSSRMHKFLRSILRNSSLAPLIQNLHLTWQSSVDKEVTGAGTATNDLIYNPIRTIETIRNKSSKSVESHQTETSAENTEKRSEMEEFYRAAVGYGLDPVAFECVTSGSETATAFILLCSLPNLVKLCIKPWYATDLSTAFGKLLHIPMRSHLNQNQGQDQNHDHIHPFRTNHNDNGMSDTTSMGSRFLTKLEFFGWQDCVTGGGYDMKAFIPFFFLPSIRTIEARLAYGDRKKGFNGQEFSAWREFEQYFGTSPVEKIQLTDCKITGRCLKKLLLIPRRLKEFVYEDSKAKGGQVWIGDLNLNRVLIEALSHVSQTLEVLSINWDHTNFHDSSTFRPVTPFRVLSKLAINFDVLFGLSPKESIEMAKILPPLLEELLLFEAANRGWARLDYVETVRQLLHHVGATKDSLTNIKRIYMTERTLEPLVELGNKVGISVGYMDWTSEDGKESFGFKAFVGVTAQ